MLVSEADATDRLHAEAEELADLAMKLQRRFLLHLSEELARGSVSFPQFFLLTYLAKQESLTMSGIAAQMGHTTAAATGLVDRLEKLGYVHRSHALDDRRKVIVKITRKGSNLVARIRQDMINKISSVIRDRLSPEESSTWIQIYRKISDFCETSPKNA
ncbi:MAG: MarR family transcriptional regulator [Verrucomicrobia bacterium]|nr:MarR family transcriptional regulator [Verrucomicrobiota bacterium]